MNVLVSSLIGTECYIIASADLAEVFRSGSDIYRRRAVPVFLPWKTDGYFLGAGQVLAE